MDGELKLRIIVEQPPAGVDFGIQKGRGSIYETVEKQRSNGGDLEFDVSVAVDTRRSTPALSGPFVQGPPAGRFVYIDIGTLAGQADSRWTRRMKIPLAGITPPMIASGKTLEARVPGTGRDGGPACATVKDFDGWKLSGRR